MGLDFIFCHHPSSKRWCTIRRSISSLYYARTLPSRAKKPKERRVLLFLASSAFPDEEGKALTLWTTPSVYFSYASKALAQRPREKTAGHHSLFPLLIKAVIKPVDPPGTQSCAVTRERESTQRNKIREKSEGNEEAASGMRETQH
jgi:hypothetical protein